MNSLFVIRPYKYYGQWVFDDADKGLNKEALVAGIDKMLDIWAAQTKASNKGLVITFSESFFPGINFSIDWVREDVVGNWYESKALGFQGWLCPALFKYFPQAPKQIFAKIEKAI
jgi:hypothetical protein